VNIFFVDRCPKVAAEYSVDRHCVKMILESAQLLSTAHRVLDGVATQGKSPSGRSQKQWTLNDSREYVLYKATHINHPSAVWCRESVQNYNWLVEHFFALCAEYTRRYNKTHKCAGEISYMLQSPPNNLKKYNWTEMPCCMPKEYIISNDAVENYRQYYRIGKKALHSWKKRAAPIWI
jgi:hypothetical protein